MRTGGVAEKSVGMGQKWEKFTRMGTSYFTISLSTTNTLVHCQSRDVHVHRHLTMNISM